MHDACMRSLLETTMINPLFHSRLGGRSARAGRPRRRRRVVDRRPHHTLFLAQRSPLRRQGDFGAATHAGPLD